MNHRYLVWLLYLLACYFPLFLHLDSLSLRLWDESRQAVNALEMAQNGNWLVTYFAGEPDLWNVKPPFVIWCQAFLMKVLGTNELAVRLPSALAGLATVVLLPIFTKKVLKNETIGFLAGLVLVTASGIINNHGTRSGDYDAMLMLWETLYLFSFFAYLETNNAFYKKRLLLLTGIAIILAVLTKGIAGLFFAPALAIYTVFRGQLFSLLKNRPFLLMVGSVITTIGLYYLGREAASSGYLAAVYQYELGGRYLEVIDGHTNDYWYYLRDFYEKERFMPWLFFLPLGLLIGYFQKGRTRRLTLLLTINISFILMFLSFGATRLRWYLNPLYPSVALLVAFSLEKMLTGVWNLNKSPISWQKYLLTVSFLFALFFMPYKNIVQKFYLTKDDQWEWQKTQYRDFIDLNVKQTDYTILHPHYNGHVIFYQQRTNWKNNTNIKQESLREVRTNRKRELGSDIQLQINEKVMICEKEALQALQSIYLIKKLNNWKSCQLVEITGKINN